MLDIREYGRFNGVYIFFKKDLPARTCVQAAKLPFGARVEIGAIACVLNSGKL